MSIETTNGSGAAWPSGWRPKILRFIGKMMRDIVCGPYTAADLDVVVVPLQQSFLIKVQCLLCTVRRDIRGKADLQTTPRFSCFFPGSISSDSTPGLARKNGAFIYVHIAQPAKYASCKSFQGVPKVCPLNDDRD